MKKSDRKRRQRRRARNIDGVKRLNWPSFQDGHRERMLTPPRPDRYTGLARYRRLRKKVTEQGRAYQPQRITKAVKESLIRYKKWRDGELEDIAIHEEQAFEDLLRFWSHWLSWIEDAASGSLDLAALEPIWDLTRLLDDLRTGAASSDLRKGLVKAGTNSDPGP